MLFPCHVSSWKDHPPANTVITAAVAPCVFKFTFLAAKLKPLVEALFCIYEPPLLTLCFSDEQEVGKI
jgi:hypothetical protein